MSTDRHWSKVHAGRYISDDGWLVESQTHGDEESAAEVRERKADSTGVLRANRVDWFLYDPDGNMIDAYPTFREAKARAGAST